MKRNGGFASEHQQLVKYDQAGTGLQQVIQLHDLPVGLLKGSALYYVQPDHLGTLASSLARLITLSSGVGI